MVNSLRPAAGLREGTRTQPDRAGRGPGRTLMMVLGVALLVITATGCSRARAETAPDGPPLATPAPPPRMLAPVEAVVAEAPAPQETPAEVPPEAPAERRPEPRRPPAADPQKTPEPPPATPPPVVAETPAVRQPALNQAEERKIFEILQRFNRDIARVDYKNLQGEGKAQYDQAKRFSELAEQEIKNRNYPLAATHADKAATIAEQLRGL